MLVAKVKILLRNLVRPSVGKGRFLSSASDASHVVRADEDFQGLRREEHRCLKVAILGMPNVGKSTLINNLVYRSVCPASSKVHTTKVKAKAIYSEENTQLVFVDTPGLLSEKELRKYNLAETFPKEARGALSQVDMVGVVQDVSNIYNRHKIPKNVLEMMKFTSGRGVGWILILNKIDQIKKKHMLLKLVDQLTTTWPNFDDVFMVSALENDGIRDLREYLLRAAKPQDWEYREDVFTDRSEERLIEETIRARLLDDLPHQIPYELAVQLEFLDKYPDGRYFAHVVVTCPKEKYQQILHRRGRMSRVAITSADELRNAFRAPFRVSISTKLDERERKK